MKSPVTGKEMKLMHEKRMMDFRKETFEINFHFFECEDSGEQFTTTELDELNLNQAKKTTTHKMVELSHLEDSWKKNEKKKKQSAMTMLLS